MTLITLDQRSCATPLRISDIPDLYGSPKERDYYMCVGKSDALLSLHLAAGGAFIAGNNVILVFLFVKKVNQIMKTG